MDNNTSKQLTCEYCKQGFSKKFNLNRHLKNIHNKENKELFFQSSSKKSHIICVVCSVTKVFGAYRTYKEYIKHLQETHEINVEQKTYHFNNKDSFENWRCREKRDVDYVIQNNSMNKTSTKVYYNCNRSDTKGYISNCSKKILKTGGSIKINGTCPSRIIATFLPEGEVMVIHNYTHVGHKKEVRTQRLSKVDQKYLVEQLEAGVNTDQIIKNARQQQSSVPSRLNLVTKNDLTNLMRRKNIEGRRRNTVVLAHKKAETMKNCIQEEGFGHFIITSSQKDKFYNVLYKEQCMYTNCREMFCEACKVCFHKYECECVEYSVKSTTCKHVHVVAMYEQERQQFLTASTTEEVPSIENEILQTINDQKEISDFLGKKSTAVNCNREISIEQKKSLVMEQALNYLNQMSGLDNNSFAVFEKNFHAFMTKNNKDLKITDSKRKFKNQTYYPRKKRKS